MGVEEKVGRLPYTNVTELLRKLRQQATPAEKVLWQALRNHKLEGYKFRRQEFVHYDEADGRRLFFIPDFYCPACKVAIELDGKIHDFSKDYDQVRDALIGRLGIVVIRFKNEDLENLDELLGRILAVLRTRVKRW